jgi:hypothetical protein
MNFIATAVALELVVNTVMALCATKPIFERVIESVPIISYFLHAHYQEPNSAFSNLLWQI